MLIEIGFRILASKIPVLGTDGGDGPVAFPHLARHDSEMEMGSVALRRESRVVGVSKHLSRLDGRIDSLFGIYGVREAGSVRRRVGPCSGPRREGR